MNRENRWIRHMILHVARRYPLPTSQTSSGIFTPNSIRSNECHLGNRRLAINLEIS